MLIFPHPVPPRTPSTTMSTGKPWQPLSRTGGRQRSTWTRLGWQQSFKRSMLSILLKSRREKNLKRGLMNKPMSLMWKRMRKKTLLMTHQLGFSIWWLEIPPHCHSRMRLPPKWMKLRSYRRNFWLSRNLLKERSLVSFNVFYPNPVIIRDHDWTRLRLPPMWSSPWSLKPRVSWLTFTWPHSWRTLLVNGLSA